MKNILRILLTAGFILCLFSASDAQDKKALGITDIMKFRQVESPSISNDGNWVVHTAKPDRGDPEVLVYSTDGKKKYMIPRGEKPVLSNDGKWVAAVHAVPAEELLKSKPAKGGKKPEAGLTLLNTTTGEQAVYESVKSFRFSNDSKWLLYHSTKEQKEDEKDEAGDLGDREWSRPESDPLTAENDTTEEETKKKSGRRNTGSVLNVLSLEDDTRMTIPFVMKFSVDSISRFLAYAVADSTGEGNGVFLLDLTKPKDEPVTLYTDSCAWADWFSWNNRKGILAFLAGIEDEKENRRDAELWLWIPGSGTAGTVLGDDDLAGDWKLYHKNNLRWSKDGERLFLGTKPGSEIIPPEDEKKDTVSKLFNAEAILADRTLDVWHWNDPYINSNQKKMWDRIKDRTYTGVYYPGSGKFIQLADEEMPELRISDNKTALLGSSNVPYAKRMTWEGRISDYYLVNPASGERKLVVEEQEHRVYLSPDGKFLVYFREGDWHMLDASTGKSRNLTEDLGVPFADEDWDYPGDVPGYRVGGWIKKTEGDGGAGSILIYDKYDIWEFPVSGGNPVCLTSGKGREQKLQFRIERLDRDKEYLEAGESMFLTAYHDLKKYTAIYSMKTGTPGVTMMAEGPAKYSLLAKAKDADKILYTRESYTEFPDLWATDGSFKKPRKLSDVNPQVKDFAWGQPELVEWSTVDGIPLQGVLIKPGNYKPGQKYPVLVYYYRISSDRLYEFNQVVINHRPCFPFYASNGYAIFLPDIRFDVGNPGYSATKCLVPGVQKIIDMGIADPDAVCLHGHSWSGYQTAFVVTQTDMFACAIAGAPVSNMTSAYSGIRWGTGLARQFQYEQSQSRIGGNLWEARDKYIENSPVFYADHINTPLLIQFGDQDEAVPWYQGIELYLAMRRLEKDCVFLQYRGEPHHLKQYANKLDYTLKFKQYLDHYLKGEPAPDWIKSGIPYKGK